MEVRRADSAEREALLQLLGAQLADHGTGPDRVRLEIAVDGVLADSGRGVLLAIGPPGRPDGVAYLSFCWTLEHGGRVGWLEELYVRPDRRGAGIGTALLEAVLREAVAAGCRAVDLEVDRAHARAEALYLRHGFRALGRNRFSIRLGE